MSFFSKRKEKKAEKELNDYILSYQKLYVDELIEMSQNKQSNFTAILALFLILDEAKRIYDVGEHKNKLEQIESTRNIMMGVECDYTIWSALFYELNKKITVYGIDPMLLDTKELSNDELEIIGMLSELFNNVFIHPNGIASINNTFDEIYDYAQNILDNIEVEKNSHTFKEASNYSTMLKNLKAKLSSGNAIINR